MDRKITRNYTNLMLFCLFLLAGILSLVRMEMFDLIVCSVMCWSTAYRYTNNDDRVDEFTTREKLDNLGNLVFGIVLILPPGDQLRTAGVVLMIIILAAEWILAYKKK